MDQQLFEGIVYDLRDNIQRKAINTANYHLDYPAMKLKHVERPEEYACAHTSVRSQIVGLINAGVKINLGSTLSKLYGHLKPLLDEHTRINYAPVDIAEQLLRYCELNRAKNLYILYHQTSRYAYGMVSDRHQITQDADIYDLYRELFQEIPHTAYFSHNYFRMKIDITMDDIELELEDGNSMKLRVSLGNSMFGVGSAFVKIGSWEQICSNGAMGWNNKLTKEFGLSKEDAHYFPYTQRHTYAPSHILGEMKEGIIKQLGMGQEYIEVLEEAHSIESPIIKKVEDIEKELQKDKFGLGKAEAEEVYKLLMHKHKQYKRRNAFDVGRAIAEVARDTVNLDRQIELEQIAGKTMLAQVST